MYYIMKIILLTVTMLNFLAAILLYYVKNEYIKKYILILNYTHYDLRIPNMIFFPPLNDVCQINKDQ